VVGDRSAERLNFRAEPLERLSIRTPHPEDRIPGCNLATSPIDATLSYEFAPGIACEFWREFGCERHQELGVVTGHGEN
jgi:hypothetical protein